MKTIQADSIFGCVISPRMTQKIDRYIRYQNLGSSIIIHKQEVHIAS